MNVSSWGDALEPTGSTLLNVAVRVVPLIVLTAIIARLTARNNPALRHGLWLSTLVGVLFMPLLVGFSPMVGFSWVALPIGGDSPQIPRRTATIESRYRRDVDSGAVDAAEHKPGPPESVLRQSQIPVARTNPHWTGSEETALSSAWRRIATIAAQSWQHLGAIVALVWLLGVLLGTGRLVIGALLLARLRSQTELLDSTRLEFVLSEVRGALGIANLPPIVWSDNVTSPAAAGVWHPMVLLPRSLQAVLGIAKLRDVLIHECAHVVRRDHWIGLLQRIAAVLYWPHPLVHFCNRALSRAREEVCDNYVLKCGHGATYARILLELSERLPPLDARVPSFGLLESRWSLEERVRGLLDRQRKIDTRLGGVLRGAMVIACAMSLVGLAGIRLANASANADTTKDSDNSAIGSAPSASPPLSLTVLGAKPIADDATVQEWISQLHDPDLAVRQRAARALAKIGPGASAAIPTLIDVLGEEKIGREARLALARIGPAAVPALIEALESDDKQVRWWAAQAIEEIGPAAKDAIPALIASFDDVEHPVNNAASALAAMQALAMPQLVEILKNPGSSPNAKAGACWTVWAIGPKAKAAVPLLIEALKDKREPSKTGFYPVCIGAVHALGSIGSGAKAAVPALAELLHDPSPTLRRYTAEALAEIGPSAAPAVPDLIGVLAEVDEEVTVHAAVALGKIGDAAQTARDELVKLLLRLDGDVNGARREMVAEAIGRIGPSIAPAVIEAFEQADAQHKPRLVMALGAMRQPSPAALQVLIQSMGDEDSTVRIAALEALTSAAYSSKETVSAAIPSIIRALKDTDATVRTRAAITLFFFGEDAKSAVPALIEALADTDSQVRGGAAWALLAMGPAAEGAVPALEEATEDRDRDVRQAAAKALERIQSKSVDGSRDQIFRQRWPFPFRTWWY